MDEQKDLKETANSAPPVLDTTGRKVTEPPIQKLPDVDYAKVEKQAIAKQIVDVTNQLLQHNLEVQKLMCWVAGELAVRGTAHDGSKFLDEEFNTFVEFTPLLKTTTYDSKEYKAALEKMKPALKHHYEANRHHPEHFEDGIWEMNLIDIIEMFCDWYASTKRQENGDIRKSICANADRFQFTDELAQILLNTVDWDERG